MNEVANWINQNTRIRYLGFFFKFSTLISIFRILMLPLAYVVYRQTESLLYSALTIFIPEIGFRLYYNWMRKDDPEFAKITVYNIWNFSRTFWTILGCGILGLIIFALLLLYKII